MTGVSGGLEYPLAAAELTELLGPCCDSKGVEEESRLDVSLKILAADGFGRRAKRRLKLSVHFTGHPTGGVASGDRKTGFCVPQNTWLCQLENSEEIDVRILNVLGALTAPLFRYCDYYAAAIM